MDNQIKLSSAIDLIKKSLNIFFQKKNLILFLKIYAPLIPFQLFSIFQSYFVDLTTKTIDTSDPIVMFSKYPWFVVVAVVVNILFVLVSTLVSIAGIIAVDSVEAGKDVKLKELFVKSWKLVWKFTFLTVLVGLIVAGGVILIIIPAIIFGVWYAFSKFIFVIEGKGILASLGASKSLVAGRFWVVIAKFFAIGLFVVAFQIALSVIPYGVGSIVISLFGALFVLPYLLLYKELKG